MNNKLLDRLKELTDRELLEVDHELGSWRVHPLIEGCMEPFDKDNPKQSTEKWMKEWRFVQPYVDATLSRKQKLHYHNVEAAHHDYGMTEEHFQRWWREEGYMPLFERP